MQNLCVVMIAFAICAYLVALVGAGGAGPDPAKYLLHQFGFLALLFLLVTLSVSSIARTVRRPHLVLWRRPLGLAAFFFSCVHVSVYVVLYQGLDFKAILEDIRERPYLLIGLAAWALLVPLAMTSTRSLRRRMGNSWVLLHRTIYLIAPLAVVHQAMAQKADMSLVLIFSAVLGCFLFERIVRPRI